MKESRAIKFEVERDPVDDFERGIKTAWGAWFGLFAFVGLALFLVWLAVQFS